MNTPPHTDQPTSWSLFLFSLTVSGGYGSPIRSPLELLRRFGVADDGMNHSEVWERREGSLHAAIASMGKNDEKGRRLGHGWRRVDSLTVSLLPDMLREEK